MEQIYGWYSKERNNPECETLIVEFVEGVEFEMNEEEFEKSDIVEELREVQELCDNLYEKYKDKLRKR